MKEHGKGSIVNLDSAAGYYGCGGAAYVASKGAVISLTKHIAMRFAGQGNGQGDTGGGGHTAVWRQKWSVGVQSLLRYAFAESAKRKR